MMEIIPNDIPYRDRSEFLRGFLILIRTDKIVSKHERNMAMIIGKYFGFEEMFCKESLDSLLENEYLSEDPPVFSSPIIAEYFVKESYSIIEQIHPLTQKEIEWLLNTAEVNNIERLSSELKIN